MAESVFAAARDTVFAAYDVELQFRDKLLGGIPKDPKVIEGWIRAKAGISDDVEVRQMLIRTLYEMGAEVGPDSTLEELEAASSRLAADKHTNGFKRDQNGLYLEERAVKAGIKESVNILYADTRWGPTRKGPRNYAAERVFIECERLALGRDEPDGVHLSISHINGPGGPRSALTYFEYVERATLAFRVLVARDGIEERHWPEIWIHMQENGLGASRSQGFGRFDVTRWERVTAWRKSA